MSWVPFQVDINSPSLFLTVDSPEVWQQVIDAMRADPGKRDIMWHFLQNMRMASVQYIKSSLPPNYGVSTEIPSFGYRREHHSEQLFVGWAAAHGMDLFNEKQWPPPDYSTFSVEIPQFQCRTCGGVAFVEPGKPRVWACRACGYHTLSVSVYFMDSEKTP